MSDLSNIIVDLGSLPDTYKIDKLKPHLQTGSKTDPSNHR